MDNADFIEARNLKPDMLQNIADFRIQDAIVRLYRGCLKNVPLYKRFFATTTYAAIPYSGT